MIHVRLNSVHILLAILDKTTFKHCDKKTNTCSQKERRAEKTRNKDKDLNYHGNDRIICEQNPAASVLLMISLQDLQVRLSLCLINRVEDGRSRMLKEVEDYLLSLVCACSQTNVQQELLLW